MVAMQVMKVRIIEGFEVLEKNKLSIWNPELGQFASKSFNFAFNFVSLDTV